MIQVKTIWIIILLQMTKRFELFYFRRVQNIDWQVLDIS